MARIPNGKGIKVVSNLEKQEQTKVPETETKNTQSVPEGYHEVTGLPSKMKFYPEGTKIYARPLKLLDIKKLSSLTEETANETIKEVLSNSVKGIDIDDLLLADKYYIIYWERANTYIGDHFSLEIECEDCHKKDRYKFEIGDLEVKYVKDDSPFFNEIELPSGTKVNLGFLRIKDEKILVDTIKDNPDMDEDALNISAVIKKINGEDSDIKKSYEFLTNADMADVLVITKILTENELSIVPYVKHTCSGCGRSTDIDVSFQPDFFIPDYIL